MDRLLGIFPLGREPLGAWAAGGPHRRTAFFNMGPFLMRGSRDMEREINADAASRLSLREAVALRHSYFLMLKAAFEQR